MKRFKAAILPLTFAALMLFSMTAFAEDDKETVDSIAINVDSYITTYDSGKEVEVSTDADDYDVSTVTVSNPTHNGEWRRGDNPKLTIKLRITDTSDYKWGTGISKDDVSVSGAEGTVSKVSRSSNSIFYVYYTLADLTDDATNSGGYDLDPDDLDWDSDYGIAQWEGADDASKFNIRLYRGSTQLASVTTTATSYNFANYFTQAGTYKFKVRGMYESYRGSFEESDSFYVSSTGAQEVRNTYNGSYNTGSITSPTGTTSTNSGTSSAGGPGAGVSSGSGTTTVNTPGTTTNTVTNDNSATGWIRNSTGTWWRNADGTWPANSWTLINNAWYHFNKDGYLQTGWINADGNWRYSGADGVMYISRWTPDGYYIGANGIWVQNP